MNLLGETILPRLALMVLGTALCGLGVGVLVFFIFLWIRIHDRVRDLEFRVRKLESPKDDARSAHPAP